MSAPQVERVPGAPKSVNLLVQQALTLAAAGIPVFPCSSKKLPCIPRREGGRGHLDASTDPAEIIRMFSHAGAKLIGVSCGPRSGIDVVDIDPRHGGDEWERKNLHRLPETRCHRTGSGGRHYVFKHAPGMRNSQAKIAPGVDVRGEGGYVVFPPSAGYSIESDVDPAGWPDWLLPVAMPASKTAHVRPDVKPQQRTDQLVYRYQRYVEKLLANVSSAPEGQKHDILRNNAIALGGVLVTAGISHADAHAMLIEALPDSVVDWGNAERTAEWGLKEGEAKPLDIPDRPLPTRNGPDPEPATPPAPGGPDPEPDVDGPDDMPSPPDWNGQHPAVDAVVKRFNSLYMIVNENGKAIIYQPGIDPILKRRHFVRMTAQDLRILYMNEQVPIGIDEKKRPIYKSAANVWLGNAKRRQYVGGVTFDPSGRDTGQNVLNLWQGFAVKPRAGSWARLKDHIFKVICAGNKEDFDWVIGWLARMVQKPAERAEVAIVMKGIEGCGKGTLANALIRILGQHALAISNAKHLTGNFNAHLRDCVFLFCDEAFYAGDRAHTGVLKAIITEEFLTIEAKFQNAVQSPNFVHPMMASNEDWVVPASIDARRFCVLNVLATMVGNHAYFAAIAGEMENGGYEAMLYDLLRYDITFFNHRRAPTTEGLQEQKTLSLPTAQAWWFEVLHRGYVHKSKLGLEEHFSQWHAEVATELLVESYEAYAKARGERHPMHREALGRFMKQFGCEATKPRNVVTGEHMADVQSAYGTNRKAELVRASRAHAYSIGALEMARAAFQRQTGLTPTWPKADRPEAEDDLDDQ